MTRRRLQRHKVKAGCLTFTKCAALATVLTACTGHDDAAEPVARSTTLSSSPIAPVPVASRWWRVASTQRLTAALTLRTPSPTNVPRLTMQQVNEALRAANWRPWPGELSPELGLLSVNGGPRRLIWFTRQDEAVPPTPSPAGVIRVRSTFYLVDDSSGTTQVEVLYHSNQGGAGA